MMSLKLLQKSSPGFLDMSLDLELHKVAWTSQSSQDNLGVFMYIYLFLSGLFSQQMEIDLNFNSRKMYFLDFVWGRFGKLMEDILDIFVLISLQFSGRINPKLVVLITTKSRSNRPTFLTPTKPGDI